MDLHSNRSNHEKPLISLWSEINNATHDVACLTYAHTEEST